MSIHHLIKHINIFDTMNINVLVCIFSVYRALDKNEYNHITATYFLLAERRLKIARQEQAQLQRLNIPVTNFSQASPGTSSHDLLDGSIEISSNFLAPPQSGYGGSRLSPSDGSTATVSLNYTFSH